MKLRSLSDLEQLLSDEDRKKLNAQSSATPKGHSGKGNSVRVSLETAGRKGKRVTVVSELQHNPQTMEEIAKILKQHCGAGGTVKQRTIEIQGDHRDRVTQKLRAMDYIVK